MNLEHKKKTFEPFDDDTVIEVERKPLSLLNMATRMPDGFVNRLEDDELKMEDYAYLKWSVKEHTNQDFTEYVDSGKEVELCYVINLVFAFIQDCEIRTWEEFKEEEGDSFVNNGTLGVQ